MLMSKFIGKSELSDGRTKVSLLIYFLMFF